jgi:hypothetical protein
MCVRARRSHSQIARPYVRCDCRGEIITCLHPGSETDPICFLAGLDEQKSRVAEGVVPVSFGA